jgi:hypothetical protein
MITIAIQVHQAQKVNVEPSGSETVESTSRPLKGVDDVKCGHRLAFRMLSVSDRVTDNLLAIVSNYEKSNNGDR